ncbi:MAG: hypothetical protein HZA01_15410 [Nitrospinae bacterium]|nr:hypothetical protein [Nitrospinota bacterium]
MKLINAKGVYYKQLNEMIRAEIRSGTKEIKVTNVVGQRYIGGGLEDGDVKIHIEGVPGEDLAAFMDGPTLNVRNNAQDGVGNTMNSGKIIVHGMAGDVIGYGMRGGKIYIRDDVGYRVGIHMKGYLDKVPVMVIGGRAGDFFGEYMAGGIVVLLGATTNNSKPIVGDYCAAGMHGGTIYIREEVEDRFLGKEVKKFSLEKKDEKLLTPILNEFLSDLDISLDIFDFSRYIKLIPVSSRPYGRMYVY